MIIIINRSGTRNCKQEVKKSLQPHVLFPDKRYLDVGTEDCLYLSVFTKAAPKYVCIITLALTLSFAAFSRLWYWAKNVTNLLIDTQSRMSFMCLDNLGLLSVSSDQCKATRQTDCCLKQMRKRNCCRFVFSLPNLFFIVLFIAQPVGCYFSRLGDRVPPRWCLPGWQLWSCSLWTPGSLSSFANVTFRYCWIVLLSW